MGPHRLTSPEQTLIIQSIIGTWTSGFPFGLHVKRYTGKIFSRIVYFLRKSPMDPDMCDPPCFFNINRVELFFSFSK